jgi:hypothetical protein
VAEHRSVENLHPLSVRTAVGKSGGAGGDEGDAFTFRAADHPAYAAHLGQTPAENTPVELEDRCSRSFDRHGGRSLPRILTQLLTE